MKKVIPIIAGICLLFAAPADAADKKSATKEKTEESEESYYEQLKKLIDDLTDSGKEATDKSKQMSEEAKQWVKDDFGKIGDWEYKQIVIHLNELPSMAKRLNELGKDRWDCFWVHQQGQDIHLLCKRPAISYLQKIGRVDIMKLIPLGGDKE
ncbi:MAG: hypothetical protein ACPGVU_04105 [Limisphaerales bacterium]